MRATTRFGILSALAALASFTGDYASAVVPVANSFVGGTVNNENDGSTLDKLVDNNAFYYLQAVQTDPTWSFILDLEAPTVVSSITLWGYYVYNPNELGPGGLTTIGVSDNVGGPFTVIGSRDFGGDRASNTWSGGKGNRIDTTPTLARYVQVSGGWDYDNLLRIADLQVNGRVAIYNYSPVNNPHFPEPNPANVQQANVFDHGNPAFAVRSLHNLADGRIGIYGANPNPSPMTFDLDFGAGKSIAAIELVQFDTDTSYLPSSVIVRTSSDNTRDNFDVVLGTFAITEENLAVEFNDGERDYMKAVLTFTTPQAKQFFQIEPSGNLGVEDDPNRFRLGEIDFVEEGDGPPPVTSAKTWMFY